jgi:hypothetical protein
MTSRVASERVAKADREAAEAKLFGATPTGGHVPPGTRKRRQGFKNAANDGTAPKLHSNASDHRSADRQRARYERKRARARRNV